MITRRSVNTREARERIFLAFEGTKTEPQYFEGLIEKEEKNINVEIIPLYRGPGKSAYTNPEDIVRFVADYFEWGCGKDCSVDLFIEQMLHQLEEKIEIEHAGILFRDLKHAITRSGYANEKTIKDEDGARDVCEKMLEVNLEVPQRPRLYCHECAKFFIIVDRDPGSFTEKQCNSVYSECMKKGYELIISNPCFELWLLLHFNVKKEEILYAASIKNGLKELLRSVAGHGSGDLDFSSYHCNIGRARTSLKNENYCEKLENLLLEPHNVEANIGTNMGVLIDIIFNGRYP